MKKRILSGLLVAAMLLASLPTAAFAADDTNAEAPDTGETQTILPQSEEDAEQSTVTAPSYEVSLPTAAFAADDTNAEAPDTGETQTILPQSEEDAEQSTVTAPSYEVSTTAELSNALRQIATRAEDEATIVLKADVTLSNDATSGYISFFGATDKHITVKSEGEMKKLSFPSYGVLTGDCTFDNVNVTGSRLFCNGYDTIFTENGQIHLRETLYGGGYKTTVNKTHVVIAASGYINPSSSSGLHDVIGGSYQGSVEGDSYLEITGDIQMQGGNHLNPGCMKGDGSSGDGRDVPDVYVGGNATLIYDNKNSTDTASPAIEGTYGCEMKGDVTLDVRAGCVAGIVGTEAPVDKSIIRSNLHIIAGNPAYENTDHVLRLGSNWPIVGAGHLFAAEPGAVGNYAINGNIVIDTYENVWAWDKGTEPDSYDLPNIYGALRGDVGGSITINVHGSHVEDITGADRSNVTGNVTINAVDAELKNSYYEDEEYDEGDILANHESTVTGKCSINVDGGDVNIIRLTNFEQINEGSQITITGSPKIRTGVLSTSNYDTTPENVAVTLTDCTATIPFIQSSTHTRVTNNSDVKLNGLWLTGSLTVDEGSILKTDDLDDMELSGNVVVNGTWEQLFINSSRAAAYDVKIVGTMTVGTSGKYIGHGSTHVAGDVSSCGMMALMKPSEFGGNYAGTNAELRLPAVVTNYTAADIPLKIGGLSTGTTTVNTVDPADWQTLKKPALGDNYILSKKNTDSPAQNVFVLGNADAVGDGWFLKRMADADGTDDYYMWQVANSVRVIFDKNGGDTEADPRIMVQDKVVGAANHFDLPKTEPTRSGYLFNGWNTKADGTGDAFTATTDVKNNMTVYAQWKPDEAYAAVKIAPMNLTVYVGGDGYHGVIGEDGKFAANDLPEIGFYLTLPDDINTMLGGTDETPVDLSDKLRLTSDDDNGTMRSWSLELYSDESKSHVRENGRRVYIYKLRQIDDGEENVPRVQFTRADGSVMADSKFQALLTDQFRNYKISVYQGLLDEQIYKATFTTADGQTFTRPIKLGTGTLKVRGNNDTTYRAIENNTIPSVNPQEKDIMLVSTEQTGTQYYINNSGISVPPSDDVKLMVDHSLDDALLSAYINRTSNTEGKYSYQFRYLDLVDTSNGNTYVTMGSGQKMNLYWPVPSDAKSNSEFHIIHFKGIDRDSDADVNELLTTRIPEKLTCETVTIGGQKFVKFAVDSFSPFALLYEKDTSTPTQPSGGGGIGGGKTAVAAFTNTKDSDAPEQPVDPPKTGDTTNLGLWISLMGLSLAGLFISLVVVKKNSYHGKRTK